MPRTLICALCLLFLSRPSSAQDLRGVWLATPFKSIEVGRDGDLYKVKVDNDTFVGQLRDGVLKTNAPICSELVYSKTSDNLFFCGKEFSRLFPPPANADRTASGLTMRVLEAGRGQDHPGPDDRVTIQYTAWSGLGGFFLSYKEATVGVSAIYPPCVGLSEGIRLMVAGESRRLWIPGPLCYEPTPGGIPGIIVMDVHLVSVQK